MAKKPKGKKDKGKQQSQRGAGLTRDQRLSLRFGYGMDPKSTWVRANKKQRQTIKARARRGGTTIEGYIRGGPRSLRERTEKGLAREAQRTVKRAYAPEYEELRDQEGKVLNLREKRRADEQYFNQWLASRQDQLNAQAQQADAERSNAMVAEHAAVAQHYAQAGAQSRAAVEGGPGVDVSAGGGHSAVLDTAPQAAAAGLGVAASHERTRASQVAAGAQRAAGAQAGILFSQARTMRMEGEVGEAMDDLRADFKKLGLRRAGDVAKEIARLKDTEISKAERTREYNAAARKLGIDVGELKLKRRAQRETERSNRVQERLEELDRIRKEREFTAKEEREWADLQRKIDDDQRKGGGQRKQKRQMWSKVLSEARRATQTGEPPSWTDDAKENPLLRRAALMVAAGKKVPRSLAKRIKREYGVTVPTEKPSKLNRPPNAGGRPT